MHFWNKLSTAALMRLTILAAMDLLLGRVLGQWDIVLHPWIFLSVVTINLGLYAIMVYTGTLNRTLIGMMLGGLVATLGTLSLTGMAPPAFMIGGPFHGIGREVTSLLNRVLEAMPGQVNAGKPLRFRSEALNLIGYAVVDVVGLMVIVTGGGIARG